MTEQLTPIETYVSGEKFDNVFVKPWLFSGIPAWLKKRHDLQAECYGLDVRYAIVSDETVAPLYAEYLAEQLTEVGLSALQIVVPSGETSKNLENCMQIINKLARENFGRNTTLIAVGGGMIGDLTGFVATLYKRGVSVIQVPTTLLAQVDSSVGGKVGVNTNFGKNMIGAFKFPEATFVDPAVLKTLPPREIISGLGEIIKYGAIDDGLFEQIRDNLEGLRNLDLEVLIPIIRKCIALKAELVKSDPYDIGPRQVLNFGHTIGQAVENASEYQLTHGEAIAIGMVYESRIGVDEGFWTYDERESLIQLLELAGLPTSLPDNIKLETVLENMRQDKKRVAKSIKFVIPMGLKSSILEGWVQLEKPEEDIEAVLLS